MISLKEILNSVEEEKKTELMPVDSWRISETDFLSDVGFKPNGSYCMGLESPPMLVYRKEDGFHLKDGKQNKKYFFKEWEHLDDFFQNYKQDLKSI